LYALYVCILSNLQMRDELPAGMNVRDKILVDDKIVVSIVGVYSINFNSYLTTTLILPPLFLSSYFC
jgi:hypothetical protein